MTETAFNDDQLARARRALPPPLERLRHLPALPLILGTIADGIGRASRTELLWIAGAHLLTAGVLLAIPAAALVLVRHVRLPRRSAERRGSARSIVLNGSAVVLFALARWLRGHPAIPPDPPLLAAEVVASALLILAATARFRRLHA